MPCAYYNAARWYVSASQCPLPLSMDMHMDMHTAASGRCVHLSSARPGQHHKEACLLPRGCSKMAPCHNNITQIAKAFTFLLALQALAPRHRALSMLCVLKCAKAEV